MGQILFEDCRDEEKKNANSKPNPRNMHKMQSDTKGRENGIIS